MKAKPPSPYMTTKQVAEYFQVCVSTVRNWHKSGVMKGYHLPSVGKGKSINIRFRREDVEELARELPWKGKITLG
jgi:excisionase family DNA binding protein